ncbi:MAG: hypothetical protein FWG12_07515 [Holophagaceae bacterium]|nr:hypothetical protein [Holophagaceae bacterium]
MLSARGIFYSQARESVRYLGESISETYGSYGAYLDWTYGFQSSEYGPYVGLGITFSHSDLNASTSVYTFSPGIALGYRFDKNLSGELGFSVPLYTRFSTPSGSYGLVAGEGISAIGVSLTTRFGGSKRNEKYNYQPNRNDYEQGNDKGIRFGLRLSAAACDIELGNSSYGFDTGSKGLGIGLSVEKPLTRKIVSRGSADYMPFRKSKKVPPTIGDGRGGENGDSAPSVLGVGLDLVLNCVSPDKGLYFLLSLGFAKASLKFEGVLDTNYTAHYKTFENSGRTLAAGLGYNFTRNLGIELKVIPYGPEVRATSLDAGGYNPNMHSKPQFVVGTFSFIYRL